MTFGDYLRLQRDTRGWTQPMAAEKIGIEQSYLSKLETGKAMPSEEMFGRLVAAYGIDVDQLAQAVPMAELERLREIADIRDLLRRGQQATARGRRRWLVASLLLLTLGGALLSLVVTESRYGRAEYQYVSKGVIQKGESDFIFGKFGHLEPAWLVSEFPDDPLLSRIEPVYRFEPEVRGQFFVEPVEGGRRLFELDGGRTMAPSLDTHLGHALAVAMLIAGLGGLFVARRW